MKKYLCLLLTIGFLGCSSSSKLDDLDAKITKNTSINSTTSIDANEFDFVLNEWWTIYEDETLNTLVNTVLESNRDLEVAKLNIAKLQTSVTLAGGDSFEVGIEGGALRQKTSENSSTPAPLSKSPFNSGELKLQANYTFDIYGKEGYQIDSKEFLVDGGKHQLELAKLNIASSVAYAYGEYKFLLRNKWKLHKQEKLQLQILNLKKKGLNLGRVSRTEVLKANSKLFSIRTQIIKSETSIEVAKGKILLLDGYKNEDKINNLLNDKATNDIFNKTIAVPSGVSSSVILNRPDVKYYMALVKSQEASLKSAKTNFYPQFAIGGEIGYEAIDLSKVFKPTSLLWELGPKFYIPIYQKQIKATYSFHEIQLNILLENYNSVVIKAFHNVNNNLAILKGQQNSLENTKKFIASNRKLLKHSNTLHSLGRLSELEKLENELIFEKVLVKNDKELYEYYKSQIGLINSFGGVYKQLN